MNPELLEDILACPTLPSLPSIALEVIELASDPNVTMDALAKKIQMDQGLASKIVRTVNSSFYGLRQRCASVRKALVMLGLGPVKTLALGFLLVGSLEKLQRGTFDWVSYWRRGLYSALAARCLAEATGHGDIADEAFLAALMQDIGMVALYQTLGEEYLAIVSGGDGDHRTLSRREVSALEVSHADVGAMLAVRWRLPTMLTVPIKYHERPTAAIGEASAMARIVAVSSMVHDVLTDAEAALALRRLYERAKVLCGADAQVCDEVVKATGAHAHEMSRLFNVETGPNRNPETVLAQAERALVELSKSGIGPGAALLGGGDECFASVTRDPLTGAVGREGFAVATRRAFELSAADGRVATIVHLAIEGLDRVCAEHGEVARDEALLGLAIMLNRSFEPMGGLVCRLGHAVFAVVLPDVGRREAVRALEGLRDRVGPASRHWSEQTQGLPMSLTLSAGVASLEENSRQTFSTDAKLVGASARAAQAARAAGGNCVRTFVPRRAA